MTRSSLRVGSEEMTVRVSSAETAGALFAAEVTMPPGGGPPVMHRHDPSELYVIRFGELTFYRESGDGTVDRRVAGPGDVVPIAGGVSHTIRNESAEPATALSVYAPGAVMEGFAHAAAGLAARGPVETADVLALATRHGIEMTGPILSETRSSPTSPQGA